MNHRWLPSSALMAAALHAFCATAQSAHCTGNLGDVELRGSLDITARCELNGTEIRGNVTLFPGGSLVARDVEIRGSLEARRADFVAIEDSEIGGNVTLDELVGDHSNIENTEIDGNASLTSNRSALEIANNDIGGNLRASSNTGGISISGNSIDGNLECSDNTPAPVGLGNRVDKRSQGQCQNMRPQASSSPPAPTGPPTPMPTTPVQPPTAPPALPNPLPASRDTTPPTLSLRGAPNVSLAINSSYADAGATATDSTDGDLTSRIVVVNPVNTALLGTFTVTYSVSDSSGNAATPLTRTVTVTPEPAAGGGGGSVGIEFVLALLPLALGRLKRRRSTFGRTFGEARSL